MLTIQTGQLMVRGLAPLRSDRLVGYSVRYSFIVADFHRLLLAGFTGALRSTLNSCHGHARRWHAPSVPILL